MTQPTRPKIPKATSVGVDDEATDPALTPPPGIGGSKASPFELITPLLDDPEVTEIMINDTRNVMIEKGGIASFSGLAYKSPRDLEALARSICALIGKTPSPEHPFADGSLPDGTRVHIILPPAVPSGPCITLRRFPRTALSLEDLMDGGMLDARMARLLAACASARMNLLIAGGAGSGKTTLLNAILAYVPEQERIITIEDTAELRVPHANHVRMISSPPRPGSAGISARDLLIQSLRMRPDRLILGECRGREAFDMLQAMNTGHAGSMATLHANSGRDALSRLETLALLAGTDLPWLAVRRQMVSALNVVVQVARDDAGKRRVVSVAEVTGLEGEAVTMQELFSFARSKSPGKSPEKPGEGRFRGHGLVPTFIERLKSSGIDFPPGSFG